MASAPCADSLPWLDPAAVPVGCATLASRCAERAPSIVQPDWSFVWQRCPRTCGSCPQTCPSGLDPSASILINRVGSRAPFRLLSWWYGDVAKLGWYTHYRSAASPKRTTTRRFSLEPGGLFISDGFASAAVCGDSVPAVTRAKSAYCSADSP